MQRLFVVRFLRVIDRFPSSQSVYHSRHDESLFPRLSQHPVHKQRRVGEGVLVPLPSFIEAQPGKHKQLLRQGTALIPQLCAQANDPEMCLTTLFHIQCRAEALC